MKVRIGNGEKTLLWFDYWHHLGPIMDTLGERVIYDSGLDMMATVASIISDSAWRWPPSRSAALVDLAQSHLPPPFSLREDDLVHVMWIVLGMPCGQGEPYYIGFELFDKKPTWIRNPSNPKQRTEPQEPRI